MIAPDPPVTGNQRLDEFFRWIFNLLTIGQQETYTPIVTLVGGAGNTVPVYSTNTGRFSRIGNRCFSDVYLTGDGGAEGAGTGQINISLAIPANASHPTDYFPVGMALNNATVYYLYGRILAGGSTIELVYIDALTSRAAFTGALQNNSTRSMRLKFFHEV